MSTIYMALGFGYDRGVFEECRGQAIKKPVGDQLAGLIFYLAVILECFSQELRGHIVRKAVANGYHIYDHSSMATENIH